jgi:uracil-DNA glycosylase
VVFIGEQPGDVEDKLDRPFVGPAGQLFDRALLESGIDRTATSLLTQSNILKFEKRGKRRIHETPKAWKIVACRPWLESEMMAIHPKTIVCLGATAAHTFLDPVTA